jgi:antirestriction protein ArdC
VTRVRKTADGEEREEEFRVLRTFVVFHLDQVDGDGPTLKRFRTPVEGRTEFDRYEEAERVIAATGAAIHHGGDRAVYHRLTDAITLPPRDRFKSQADYYTTAFHEVAHWTERRLGWDGPYALGELRAEMASCFLATEVGVPQSDDLTNHQAYVASWLRALEGDPSVVFRIASAASAAADHVLGYSRPEPGQPDETILGTAARSDRAE